MTNSQTTIPRAEALRQADELLLEIISSGDEKIFSSANGDAHKVLLAGMKSREILADKIQAGEI